jgi:hypothetical protein
MQLILNLILWVFGNTFVYKSNEFVPETRDADLIYKVSHYLKYLMNKRNIYYTRKIF